MGFALEAAMDKERRLREAPVCYLVVSGDHCGLEKDIQVRTGGIVQTYMGRKGRL